jgi:hypothetical protein
MENKDLSVTQPASSASEQTSTSGVKPSDSPPPGSKLGKLWLWAIFFALILAFTVTIGAVAGYQSGNLARHENESDQSWVQIQEQYDLGLQDLEAGNYEVALQRFEYVLAQDPNFPGITEQMAAALGVLYSTATPIPQAPAISATPTRDPRPVEDLFNQALSLISSQDWSKGIDTLIALRKEDLSYQVARVDGLLYIGLRNRGVGKILKESNLEGGIYDLALADKFGPLDAEASSAREWARLFIIGLSFWEVHPELAVHYFNQVAAAAPYLRDASGWTANDRYRAALIQFGSFLAHRDNWCAAQTQYELALAIRPDETLQALTMQAAEMCSPSTPTPSGTGTTTITPTYIPTATQEVPSTTEVPTTTIVPPTTEVPPTTVPPTTEVPPTDTPIPPPTATTGETPDSPPGDG